MNPELPEDLYCLIKKAVSVRKHLERNRQDNDAKFGLILIESRAQAGALLQEGGQGGTQLQVRVGHCCGACVVECRK